MVSWPGFVIQVAPSATFRWRPFSCSFLLWCQIAELNERTRKERGLVSGWLIMAGRKWVDSGWVTQIPQLNGTFHPEPDDASQFPNRLAQQGLEKRINHLIKMPRWTVIIKHMHRALVQDVSQEREPNQATAKQRQGRLSCKRARYSICTARAFRIHMSILILARFSLKRSILLSVTRSSSCPSASYLALGTVLEGLVILQKCACP